MDQHQCGLRQYFDGDLLVLRTHPSNHWHVLIGNVRYRQFLPTDQSLQSCHLLLKYHDQRQIHGRYPGRLPPLGDTPALSNTLQDHLTSLLVIDPVQLLAQAKGMEHHRRERSELASCLHESASTPFQRGSHQLQIQYE